MLFSGQRAFIVQRLGALVMLACVAAAALRLALGAPVSGTQWQAWSAQPPGAILVLLLAFAVFSHAWVGVRDVALDYIKPPWLRLAVLAAAALGLAALAAWTVLIVAAHAL